MPVPKIFKPMTLMPRDLAFYRRARTSSGEASMAITPTRRCGLSSHRQALGNAISDPLEEGVLDPLLERKEVRMPVSLSGPDRIRRTPSETPPSVPSGHRAMCAQGRAGQSRESAAAFRLSQRKPTAVWLSKPFQ